MFARLIRAVNLLLPLACTAPIADTPPIARVPGELGLSRARLTQGVPHGLAQARLPALPIGGTIDTAPRGIPVHYADESLLSEIGPDLQGLYTGGGGEALEAALEEKPSIRVENYGVAALTLDELFGDTFHPGLCEDAEVVFFDNDQGQEWQISLSIPSFMAYVGEVEAYMAELTGSCKSSLAEAGGDLEEAVNNGYCIEDDIQQFFPEGSTCRACVEGNGGDFDACVDSGACTSEAPQVSWVGEDGEKVWYQMATGYIYACAPTYTVLTLILAKIPPDGTLPASFDHENWSYLCIPYWDEELDAQSWTCFAGEGGPARGDAMLEGMVGRVNYASPTSDLSQTYYRNTFYYAHSMTFVNDAYIGRFWGYSDGAGVFSMPPDEPDSNGNGVYDLGDENYGFGLGGWGINPYALRPDGSDPTELDHTLARDWLGTMALKFATTRDGVYIHTYNHNRCLNWEGPFDDGSYRCTDMDLPTYGWHNDVQNTWNDSSFTQAYVFPFSTIASTGLPDPDIPGGMVPLIAGSPTLADPDWDDCAWPNSYVPDLAPMEDTPADFGGPAAMWAQTYRFGKDPDLDIRVALNTNMPRGFCPAEETP